MSSCARTLGLGLGLRVIGRYLTPALVLAYHTSSVLESSVTVIRIYDNAMFETITHYYPRVLGAEGRATGVI